MTQHPPQTRTWETDSERKERFTSLCQQEGEGTQGPIQFIWGAWKIISSPKDFVLPPSNLIVQAVLELRALEPWDRRRNRREGQKDGMRERDRSPGHCPCGEHPATSNRAAPENKIHGSAEQKAAATLTHT